MTDEPVPPAHRGRARMAGRAHPDRRSSPGGSAALVARGGIAVAAGGLPRAGGALGAPRFVDETPRRARAYVRRRRHVRRRRRGRRLRLRRTTAVPDVYLAGGGNPAALFRNESPTGGALRFTPVAIAGDGSHGRDGRLPDRHRQRRDRRPRRPAHRGTAAAARPRRLPLRAGERHWGLSPTTAVATAFSATWEGGRACRRWRSATTSSDAAPTERYVCPDSQLFRPDASAQATHRRSPLVPGYCPLSMLFSDWDGSGRRDLRVSNDRQYYDNDVGRRAAVAVRAGRAPAPVHRRGRLGARCVCGAWASPSYDVTGDGYPGGLPHEPGRQHPADPGRRGDPGPTYHDIALDAASSPRGRSSGGDPLPSTAWHPEFQDVNNDGYMDLFVTKGNVNQIPDYARRIRTTCSSAGPTGSYVERSEAAGIVSFDRGRGAALADFNGDGLLDLVVANLGAPARLWRNVGSGSADDPAPMGHWLGRPARPAGTEPRRHRRHRRDPDRRTATPSRAGRSSSAAATSGGQLGWTHVGLGSARRPTSG